jgi:hypothetical protein
MKSNVSQFRASRDARRRSKIDQTIAAFRRNTDRETMVGLAAEIVRLNRNIAALKEGIERTGAGEILVLMPQGPLTEKISNEERSATGLQSGSRINQPTKE